MNPLESTFNGIQHIGVPVTDLDRSVAFYGRLGFEPVMAAGFEHEGGAGQCRMLQRGAAVIELYQMPPAGLEEIRGRGDGHIDHVAFDVADIERAFAELREAGFTIDQDAPVALDFRDRGCRFFHVIGPDGERLEFNQILCPANQPFSTSSTHP